MRPPRAERDGRGRWRPTRSTAASTDCIRGRRADATSRYAPAMRPTARDFIAIAIFVLVLVVLLVVFVAAALPPARA